MGISTESYLTPKGLGSIVEITGRVKDGVTYVTIAIPQHAAGLRQIHAYLAQDPEGLATPAPVVDVVCDTDAGAVLDLDGIEGDVSLTLDGAEVGRVVMSPIRRT